MSYYTRWRKTRVAKFNPNHDELGRFSSGPGGGASITDEQATGVRIRLENKLADHAAAVAEYNALPDTLGGKVLNTDLARELSPDYAKDKDSRSALSVPVHEPSSAFIKQLYAEKLAQPPAEGELPVVLFTAGGTGAGKSTALDNITSASGMVAKSQIIYDTNMNKFESATQKVDAALAAGKDVHIAFVYRDPVDALINGALPRAMRMGRTVPLTEHAKTHNGSLDVIQRMMAHYKDNPAVKFTIIDNSLGKGNAKKVSIDEVVKKAKPVNTEELLNAAKAEYEAGRISTAVFRGTTAPPRA